MAVTTMTMVCCDDRSITGDDGDGDTTARMAGMVTTELAMTTELSRDGQDSTGFLAHHEQDPPPPRSAALCKSQTPLPSQG